MSLVTASIDITAPRQAVWDFVMDPKRLKDWVTIHRRLVRADEGPPRVGYRMDQVLHLRGVNVEVHWELVECVAPELAVWEGRGPARSRAHTEYRLREQNACTSFDYRNDFRAPLGGLGAIVSRALVGGIPEREAQRTLRALSECTKQEALSEK
jgi:carbon monoxide dehydrogenase subunit G